MSKLKAVKQSRTLVDSFLHITEAHPTWTDKQIAAYMVDQHPAMLDPSLMRFGHQDVGRLRRLAEAPAEVRQIFYAGRITAGILDTILNCSKARYLADQDKIILAEKAATGLLGGAGMVHIRKVIDLVLLTPGFRSKWADPELAWTYDDLLCAKLDQDAEFDRRRQENAEFMAKITSSISIDFGLRTQKWLKQTLEVDLRQMWDELPAIMELTFQADEAADEMEEISRSLWVLAQRVRARSGQRFRMKPAPALTLTETIDAAPEPGTAVYSKDGQHGIVIMPTPPEEIQNWLRSGAHRMAS